MPSPTPSVESEAPTEAPTVRDDPESRRPTWVVYVGNVSVGVFHHARHGMLIQEESYIPMLKGPTCMTYSRVVIALAASPFVPVVVGLAIAAMHPSWSEERYD